VTAPGPPPFARLLRDNPDTVTHLLEERTGEPLEADVVRQYSQPADARNPFGLEAGQTVTHRIAVLRGGVTMVPYVYAESAFVPARLPEAVRARLEQTKDPIGRILAAHGLVHAREDDVSFAPNTPLALDAATPGPSPIVWSRAYRLTIDDLPVFAICEWFFRSVQTALERAMPV
jgi:chorismate-pyruvate lyase